MAVPCAGVEKRDADREYIRFEVVDFHCKASNPNWRSNVFSLHLGLGVLCRGALKSCAGPAQRHESLHVFWCTRLRRKPGLGA